MKSDKVLLHFLQLFLLTVLVPAFKHIPRVPGEGFYYYLFPILFLVFFRSVYSSVFFIVLGILLLFEIYFSISGSYETVYTLGGFRPISTLFLMAFVPISLFKFSITKLPILAQKVLFKSILLFLIITLLTTSLVLFYIPNIVRELGSASTDINVRSRYSFFNIGTYSLLFNYILLFPVFLTLGKISKNKISYYFLFVLTCYLAIFCQVYAVFLMFIFNLGLYFIVDRFNIRNLRKYIILLFSTVILSVLGISIFISILGVLMEKFAFLTQFSAKTNELIGLISSNEVVEGTNIAGYEDRRKESINQFLSSPLLGGNISTGHHFWIDNLAKFGILGSFPFILSFFMFLRYFYHLTRNKKLFYLYLNSFLVFFVIGLIKNVTLVMPFSILFILPFMLLYIDKVVVNFNIKV